MSYWTRERGLELIHSGHVDYLLREPGNVPSADALDILDNNLEAPEVEDCDGIKAHIQENQRPLEEGIRRVGY
jgi:hypothetical protein